MTVPASVRIPLLVLSLAFAGCLYLPRPTVAPIPSVTLSVSPSSTTKTLVVFLPGRGDSMNDFVGKGLLATLSEAAVAVDVVCVDAHMGYYLNGSLVERLQQDVLGPARRRGYQRIVGVGISLGGLGALLTERDKPGSFDALVLIAPYLGNDRRLLTQIRNSGGAARWAALRGTDYPSSVDEAVWIFLGTHAGSLPETWLLFGRRDRYGAGQRLFADMLRGDHVTIAEGNHAWPTWSRLWRTVCNSPGVLTSGTSDDPAMTARR
jgi:pimeloyl-ACP methyl ester carboxylesterase